jgi:hypothetical protein
MKCIPYLHNCIVRQVLNFFQNILYHAFFRLNEIFIFSPFYLIVKPLSTFDFQMVTYT